MAMLSVVPAAGEDSQAQLSILGGLANKDSPQQSFVALQEEQLPLTTNVRLPWGPHCPRHP